MTVDGNTAVTYTGIDLQGYCKYLEYIKKTSVCEGINIKQGLKQHIFL